MSNKTVVKSVQLGLLREQLNQSFRTALGTHETLENILFIMELNDGTKGYGEAAIATHITGETIKETVDNLEDIRRRFVGKNIRDYLKVSSELHYRYPHNKSAIAAVETALLDALTKQWKIPLWKFFGDRPKIFNTDITIVIADLKETEETVKKYYRQGFRQFKVKIGKDFDLDIKRLKSIKRLAPKSDIYLDANQGYTAEQTLKFLKALNKIKVTPKLLEQPVPRDDYEGLKKITHSTKIPVCADESVRSLSEAAWIIEEKAATIINIKFMKFGVILSREIALLARANNVDLMMGGMLESSIAMTAAAHMAVGLGFFKYIDLDTPFFIKKEVEKNPYLSSRGVYNLSKVKPGIGLKIE